MLKTPFVSISIERFYLSSFFISSSFINSFSCIFILNWSLACDLGQPRSQHWKLLIFVTLSQLKVQVWYFPEDACAVCATRCTCCTVSTTLTLEEINALTGLSVLSSRNIFEVWLSRFDRSIPRISLGQKLSVFLLRGRTGRWPIHSLSHV